MSSLHAVSQNGVPETYLLFALNQVEQLAFFGVLKHNKDVATRIDEFKVLDDVRVIEAAQYFDLSLYFLKDALEFDLALVQNFDRNFVIRCFMHGHYRMTSNYLFRIRGMIR